MDVSPLLLSVWVAACATLDFLTSEEAGEVFASYGFTFLAE